MAVATSTAPSLAAIEPLEAGDRDAIRAFLAERPHLVTLLREAGERIPRHFPRETTALLDLVHHPEPGSRPELLLRIQTPLPMSEALGRLDRLDDEWWLDRLPQANGELTIVVWPA